MGVLLTNLHLGNRKKTLFSKRVLTFNQALGEGSNTTISGPAGTTYPGLDKALPFFLNSLYTAGSEAVGGSSQSLLGKTCPATTRWAKRPRPMPKGIVLSMRRISTSPLLRTRARCTFPAMADGGMLSSTAVIAELGTINQIVCFSNGVWGITL